MFIPSVSKIKPTVTNMDNILMNMILLLTGKI